MFERNFDPRSPKLYVQISKYVGQSSALRNLENDTKKRYNKRFDRNLIEQFEFYDITPLDRWFYLNTQRIVT